MTALSEAEAFQYQERVDEVEAVPASRAQARSILDPGMDLTLAMATGLQPAAEPRVVQEQQPTALRIEHETRPGQVPERLRAKVGVPRVLAQEGADERDVARLLLVGIVVGVDTVKGKFPGTHLEFGDFGRNSYDYDLEVAPKPVSPNARITVRSTRGD